MAPQTMSHDAPASAGSHFERLGLVPTAKLDKEELERSYFDRAARFHPDRFVGASSVEQQAAQRAAAELNEAYRVLRDPVRRVEYLVKLGGIDLNSTDPDTGAPAPSPAFLMEMLERRDALEDGSLDAEDALDEVEEELDNALKSATQALERQDVRGAAQHLVQHRYFRRLAEELSAG